MYEQDKYLASSQLSLLCQRNVEFVITNMQLHVLMISVELYCYFFKIVLL